MTRKGNIPALPARFSRAGAVLLIAFIGNAASAYDLHTKALTPITEQAKPAGAAMRFVADGRLDFAIIGDFGAERTENTKSVKSIAPAAEFLVEAFEKTTGRRPEVLDAAKDGEKIAAAKYWLLVGDSKYAREAAGLDWSKMPEHGYEIKTFARGLAIVGFDSSLVDGWQNRPLAPPNSSVGTQYGALDFCERFLGVRHYFPGENGSLWPKCRELVIEPVHYADAPYFDTHGNSYHYWVAFSDERLMEKWRPYMGEGIRLRDTSFLRYWRHGVRKSLQGSHSPDPLVYAKDHPDRLKDIFYTSPSGKFWYNPKDHVGNFYNVLDFRFADLLVADWKKMYASGGGYHPGNMHQYATDTGVSFGVCDTYMPLWEIRYHPLVKQLGLIGEKEVAGPADAAMRNVYGRFFQYLANSLERELPGKELWLLVYYNTRYAPDDPRWKLPKNVNIWLCLGDMPRKLPDPKRTAEVSVALAKEWYVALGNRAPEIMWLYNCDQDPFGQAVIAEYTGRIPAAFGKYFGHRGIFFDWGAGVKELWRNYYSAYAHEKNQWNPAFDVEAALDEHWTPFYGKNAGPHMRQFHRILKRAYEKYSVPTDELKPLYPMKIIDAMERELEAAKAAASADTAEGMRVRLVADRWPEVFKEQRERFKEEGERPKRNYAKKSIDVGNVHNSYHLTAWREPPKGKSPGEFRMTLGSTMGSGFCGLISWLKFEVNGVKSTELDLQPSDANSFLLDFSGAKLKLVPYMDEDSPLLRCRLEHVGGEIRDCRVTVTAIPSKLGRKDGKVLFTSGNHRRIVSPRPGAWVLLDEVEDGTGEEKGWGPSAVFADTAKTRGVKENAGAGWTASVTFDLKPDFGTFDFGVLERDRVRWSNDEAIATVGGMKL